MSDTPAKTAYDQVAYPSSIFIQTHPGLLAAIAGLHGLTPPDIATARVLEIGGGDGMNLIALAAAYPKARFLSFDLAASAVASGKLAIARAGLSNVQVEVGDILDAVRDLTQKFDYVICHGVYAWVPDVVRDGIMALIGKVLSADGVAYVSYNALPGGHLRLAIRDMLLRAVEGISPPAERLEAAHAFLDAYIADSGDDDRPAQAALRSEARLARKKPGPVLFHDELGDCFYPQALYDVALAAERHGLQFLGDAGEGPLGDGFLADDAEDLSTRAVVRAAQAQDDDNVRFFRQSLFVRGEQKPVRRVDPALIAPLYISSNAQRTGQSTFKNKSGEFEMSDARMVDILARLSTIYPERVQIGALSDDDTVVRALHSLFEAGLTELYSAQVPCAVTPPQRPIASALARAQLNDGQTQICTLDHRSVKIAEDAPRAFLAMLDGSHTLAELEALWLHSEFAAATRFEDAMKLVVRVAFLQPG